MTLGMTIIDIWKQFKRCRWRRNNFNVFIIFQIIHRRLIINTCHPIGCHHQVLPSFGSERNVYVLALVDHIGSSVPLLISIFPNVSFLINVIEMKMLHCRLPEYRAKSLTVDFFFRSFNPLQMNTKWFIYLHIIVAPILMNSM